MKLQIFLKSAFNLLIIAALPLALLNKTANAEDLPQWELGAGLATLHTPNYRGAKSKSSYAIPYPYLIYRGEKVNVDKDGIRTWIYKTDDLMLDISLAGGLPVASDENGPRSGMPDLYPTGEFGPSLEYRLWSNQYHHRNLWLRMPLRSAFSVGGGKIEHQGWTFAPYMEYSYYDHEKKGWKSSLSVGPIFSDDAYHDYFYGVAPYYEDLTINRPAYEASSGYSGSRVTFVLSKQFKNLWISAFARMDTLRGAVFEDSPLVETHRYHIVGTALTYVFKRSDKLVSAP